MNGLSKYTMYNITVLCYTTPGDGPRSAPVAIVTEQDSKYCELLIDCYLPFCKLYLASHKPFLLAILHCSSWASGKSSFRGCFVFFGNFGLGASNKQKRASFKYTVF